MDSKLGLQGPAVFIEQHVRQPHSMLLVLKDIYSRKTPSQLCPLSACPCPPALPPWFPCYFLSQGPLWWAATLPRCCHQLSAVHRGLGRCRSSWLVPLPPCVGFNPNPVIHTKRFLLKDNFRCAAQLQGSASYCTLAGRLEVKTLSIGA